ncbi:hypothetical protein BWI97_25570, partial [Siphonobacter sp. BAB-5405]
MVVQIFSLTHEVKKSYYHFIKSNMEGLIHVLSKTAIGQDRKLVNDDIILSNIEDAYQSSNELIKNGLISENGFKEFVLPYRVNSANIHTWRRQVWHQYHKHSFSGITRTSALVDSCNRINDSLKSWFKFSYTNKLEDTLTYSHITHGKEGTCVSMATIAAYTLRAFGVPVSIDFTPAWGNMPGSHVWNSLVLAHDVSIPFLGAEANIGKYEPLYLIKDGENSPYSTYRKPGKIYRYVYSAQKETPYYKYGHLNYFLPMSVNSRMIDVTAQYLPVSDITFTNPQINGEPKLVYINNYNDGKWVPVMATERKEDAYLFSNLARDLLYCVSTYGESPAETTILPFYLTPAGKPILLQPSSKKIDIVLNRMQSIEFDQMDVAKKEWNVKAFARIARGHVRSAPVEG